MTRRLGIVIATVALAGCDLGPSGPSVVAGTVTGSPDLGAVVLEVDWRGVTGFDGRGSTRVYSGPLPGTGTRHRLVLVDAVGGELRFSIELDDVRFDGPVITVVSAVDTADQPLPVGGLRVVLER